jgi:hypothetical protein
MNIFELKKSNPDSDGGKRTRVIKYINIFFVLLNMCAFVCLVASIVPGQFELVFIVFAIAWPFILAAIVAWILISKKSSSKKGFLQTFHTEKDSIGIMNNAKKKNSGFYFCVNIFLLIVTLGLFYSNTIQNLIFRIHENRFDQVVVLMHENNISEIKDINIGIYRIDSCKASRTGDVFFRTSHFHDGLSINTNSFGFVCSPTKTSNPFGRSSPQYYPISNKWYSFEVSDD